MLSLICEGACNKHFNHVLNDVQEFRNSPEGKPLGDRMPLVSEEIADELRSLRHTGHETVVTNAGTIYKCLDCGYLRAFGGE
jgi:hypothetical protein